jgi:3-deoxy-D-manno-octulosonate 8-phosphate phosphatase (KDO 8-P phosphatase)
MEIIPHECARRIRLLILDVDGVQTDRGLYYGETGGVARRFDVQDGTGITLAQEAGIVVAFASGKGGVSIRARAEELGVEDIYENLRDKVKAYEELKAKYIVTDLEVAYIADDVIDLPVLRKVGLGIAVADAADEVLKAATWVTVCPGGRGAVRESVEFILRAQNKWDKVLEQRYGVECPSGG